MATSRHRPTRGPSDPELAADIGRVHGEAFARIYEVVRSIRRGRVMTYGQVADAAGMPRAARVVGYAMRAAPDRVPWHRVIGKRAPGRGHITIKDPIGAALQRQLLESEGVEFSPTDAIDLAHHAAALHRASPRPPRRSRK